MTTEKPRSDDGDAEDATYRDQQEEQAELESLVEEKDDFQDAVDAQQRGEEPAEDRPGAQPPG